jgi:hypothetical protein
MIASVSILLRIAYPAGAYSSPRQQLSNAAPLVSARATHQIITAGMSKDAIDANIEFDSAFKKWKRYSPDWLKLYPSLNGRGTNLSLIDDFMPLDLKPMYDHLEKENKGGKFGYLPLMMGCSVGQLGALNAESFAERVNSAAKLLVDDKNTSLADPLINMLVVLRMNRSFMEFMRSNKSARYGVTTVPGLAK